MFKWLIPLPGKVKLRLLLLQQLKLLPKLLLFPAGLVHAHVALQVVIERERLATHVAFKRLDLVVHDRHVLEEVAANVEHAVARRARMLRLLRVDGAHVYVERALPRETLSARVTLVWFY